MTDSSTSANIHQDENTRRTGEGVANGAVDGDCESFASLSLMRH